MQNCRHRRRLCRRSRTVTQLGSGRERIAIDLVDLELAPQGGEPRAIAGPEHGVAIDYLSPRPGEQHLAAALAAAPGSFIDVARLVYMKLKASRLQDRADVGGLVKSGLDVDACRAYLASNAPALVARFDDLVIEAASEQ